MGAVSGVVGGRLRAREEMVRAWGRSGRSWVEGRIVRGGGSGFRCGIWML